MWENRNAVVIDSGELPAGSNNRQQIRIETKRPNLSLYLTFFFFFDVKETVKTVPVARVRVVARLRKKKRN